MPLKTGRKPLSFPALSLRIVTARKTVPKRVFKPRTNHDFCALVRKELCIATVPQNIAILGIQQSHTFGHGIKGQTQAGVSVVDVLGAISVGARFWKRFPDARCSHSTRPFMSCLERPAPTRLADW